MPPSQKRKPTKKPPALGQSGTKPWVRVAVIAIVVVLAVGSLGVLFLDDGSDDSTDTSTFDSSSSTQVTTSTTAAAPMASAAGKPCVALADPLPAGAPQIPVTVGPPPPELVSTDLEVGTGATVEATSTLTVDYLGVSCSTGKIFDTSYGSQPAEFPLSDVIPGWQKGLPGMKVGGTRLLGIPPADAYGAEGSPPVIAPDETLWFVVQVKDATPTTG